MLPTDERLRRNRDFRTAFGRGRSFGNVIAVLTVYKRRETDSDWNGRRFGFVVSKKQGASVARNRIKRRLREAVRQLVPTLRELPVDLIFVGKAAARDAEWTHLVTALDELFARADLIEKSARRRVSAGTTVDTGVTG